jgi:hypothetical protein
MYTEYNSNGNVQMSIFFVQNEILFVQNETFSITNLDI